MSRRMSQIKDRWEQQKFERELNRALRSASPRLREEYFAARRNLDA